MIQQEKKRNRGKREEEKGKEQRERENRESAIFYHFSCYTTSSTCTQSTISNMNGTIKCEAIR
jgi:hypothetical protein